VQLVGGDFDISGSGTITLIEGNRILAFGHDLFNLGDIDVPMTGSYVYDIMPSVMISSKIMSSTQVVGRVYRDTQTATAGEIGVKADQLPLTVEVVDRDRGKMRDFRLRLARIKEMLPSLAAISVMTAVDETRGRASRGTAHVITEIETEGRPVMRREDLSYSDGDAAAAAMPAVLRPLATFMDTALGKLQIKRVRVRVEIEQERRTAVIERVTVPQSRVWAGDEVTLRVSVRPYGKPIVEMPVRLRLPRDLPRGMVRLVISGGGEADEARASVGAPRPAPISMNQLVERYVTQDRRQDLVVQAALPRVGVALLGEELPDAPRGALDAIRASHPTDLRPQATVMKITAPTQWSLSGRQQVTLSVESSIAPTAPAPQPPQAHGPPQPPPGGPPGAPPEEDQGQEEDVSYQMSAGSALPADDLFGDAVEMGAASDAGKPQPPASGAKKEQAKPDQESKPLTHGPQAWVQENPADYGQAKLKNIAIADDGRLTLGPERSDLAKLPADEVWSLAVRDGTAYAGTGSDGIIYRIPSTGDATAFFSTSELNVHALAFDRDGNLYAGTSPRGKLFRISPDGSGKVVYDSESTYLWCLAIGPDGTVYAGGGSPARIYAVAPTGKAKLLSELPASNVLSLVLSPSGELYAGTSDSGVIFRIRPDATPSAVGQVPSNEVAALALDEKGNLFAGASPAGDMYWMEQGKSLKLYAQSDERNIYSLGILPGGDLVAATGPSGILLRFGSDRRPRAEFKPETGIATALVVSGGATYLGTTAPAAVMRFGPGHASSGVVESVVLDADRPARWGHVELAEETPTGTAVAVETRSGDTPLPEAGWSDWAPVPSGVIASPSANHLQYRLNFTTTDAKLSPVVRQVYVAYHPANLPPAVALKAPSAGDRIQKKYTVKWDARDPDKDTLTYDLLASRDFGGTWSTLKQNLTELKYEWDTTPTADGRVMLKVIASDRQSEPSDPMQDDDTVVIWVDNTPPQVILYKSSLVVTPDRRVRLNGTATDNLSPIRSVEYRVDGGDWQSLPLAAVDALSSDFAVSTEPLSSGKHTVEARAFDAAGNTGNDKLEAEVKGAAPAGANKTSD
jgi:sugar lactone lactonase YvrE